MNVEEFDLWRGSQNDWLSETSGTEFKGIAVFVC